MRKRQELPVTVSLGVRLTTPWSLSSSPRKAPWDQDRGPGNQVSGSPHSSPCISQSPRRGRPPASLSPNPPLLGSELFSKSHHVLPQRSLQVLPPRRPRARPWARPEASSCRNGAVLAAPLRPPPRSCSHWVTCRLPVGTCEGGGGGHCPISTHVSPPGASCMRNRTDVSPVTGSAA